MEAWMDARPQACLALHKDSQRVWLAPRAGGRILRWSTDLPRGRHDWLVPVTNNGWPAHTWPKGGMFPLAPFSNRVRDGRLHWQGEIFTLSPQPGQRHALHGQGQTAAWDVVDTTSDSATLRCEHRAGDDGWPWTWVATQTIRLHPDRLNMALTLVNQGESAMPAGLGLHPYFTADSVTLHASTLWEHEAELALGPRPNHQAHWERGSDTWTTFLSGWDRHARVRWQNGPELQLVTTSAMSHLVLHAPEGRYLCVEPVTHVCDAANLAAAGMTGTGLCSLAPGESLSVGADFIVVSGR